jgi:HAMP domain-containing protein
MGIRGRLITIVLFMSFIAVAAIGAASYLFSTSHAIAEAKDKGDIIFNYIMAQRDFFRQEQRALAMEIVEKDRFYPVLMSGFTVTRSTWDRFKKTLPGYMFKQATIDPLFPANKADADELNIISEFQADDAKKRLEGVITKKGEDYFYIATPIKVIKKGCLRCHGDPADAPKDQIELYGTETGYNWKMGDTVASFIVYVSIDKAMEEARKTTVVLILIGGGTILLLIVSIWLFINGSVVKPILDLSTRAEEVSLGRNLQETIGHKSDDEIGHLASAINRLRISLVKVLKRIEKK